MMDFPFKLFDPAILVGGILYGLICLLWLQPLVEFRMAEKLLIPHCKKNLEHMESSAPVPRNDKRQELEMIIEMYERTGMGQIPYVGDIIEMARGKLEAMQPKQYRSSKIERTSICGCSVDKAFAQVQFPMTLHVASLRTHTPSSIKTLKQSIVSIAASGTCGFLPWKRG